jgi:hypothetical protein
VTITAALTLSLLLAGCATAQTTVVSDPTATSESTYSPKPRRTPLAGAVIPPTIKSEMVGEWKGTVDGSFGHATMKLVLLETAEMSSQGSGLYCRLDGTWGVTEDNLLLARGEDCDGTRVTFEAPVTGDTLTGRWTASSGNSGSFSVELER